MLRAVAEERCTAIYGVPTMFIAMLDHPRFAASTFPRCARVSWRGALSGRDHEAGGRRDAHGRSDHRLRHDGDLSGSFQSHVRTIRWSAGSRPSATCIRTRSEDRRRGRASRAAGVAGELCTRGYSVMLGYWNDEARTAEVLDADGWMHTGDLATLDEQGYCNILGRSEDMVIRGGENISPREIEDFLHLHPHVSNAQVVGVPDAKYGEELCAWIILREGRDLTADELRRFCEGQIAHYKIPRYIKFVDSYPMTVTGKVQKYLIREQMRRELGLEENVTA